MIQAENTYMVTEATGEKEVERPFQLVKYYSVTSLVIILMFTVVISSLVSMRTNDLVLKNQSQFANLLAENLNHQVMVRFVVPTLADYGQINVGQPDQFKLLDAVVKNTIHSFRVLKVNILDLQGNTIYSTDSEYIGRVSMVGTAFQVAVNGGSMSLLEPNLSPLQFGGEGERRLRTVVPLRDERRRTAELGPPRAVFEIVMDVTRDFHEVWLNQMLIVAALMCMMVLLFVILRSIVQRGQRIMARQARERTLLEEQLNQAQRLASLGRMIAGVAHEIRNPLGIIRSTAELLGSRIQEPMKPLSGVIVEESNRLNQIVTEFLDFARPQEPKTKPLMVEDVLERNLRFLAPESERLGINIVRSYDRRSWPAQADADLLYRTFMNIINNSVQAMGEEGGILRVSTRAEWAGDRKILKVIVEDSGPGIDEETASHIFEPFYTTKEKGTGLGLSIVGNIISALQGRISVGRSKDLGGVSVTVELPAA